MYNFFNKKMISTLWIFETVSKCIETLVFENIQQHLFFQNYSHFWSNFSVNTFFSSMVQNAGLVLFCFFDSPTFCIVCLSLRQTDWKAFQKKKFLPTFLTAFSFFYWKKSKLPFAYWFGAFWTHMKHRMYDETSEIVM